MQRHDLGKREILVGYDDVLYGIRSSSRLRERERTKSRNLMEGLPYYLSNVVFASAGWG